MDLSRRHFLAGSAATMAAMTMPRAFAMDMNQDTLKVGLIGCGGRGSGAIRDNMAADSNAVVWAVGDVFEDHVKGFMPDLEKDLGARVKIENRKFVGFDAYQKVIDSGVDIVILTTPPGFRPIHFKAAVDAGKHVFFEKPVAVDGPGIREVIAAAEQANQKKLSVVAGTQRRHDVAYNQCIEKIHAGAIGDVTALYAYWNQGGLWMHPRQDTWSDVEWQLRNWLYFAWLSGDHIVEQHVHNLDVCNWIMKAHPVKCTSLAGRQVRTDKAYGHIFDHFATEYEYANGVKMVSMCRQIDGTASRVSEHIVGSKGTSNANTSIKGETPFRFDGDRPNPYVEEHKRLYKSIRAGEGFNEGKQVAESTLTAIMGRMSAYTGQEVTWDQALNSTASLMPEKVAFGPMEVAPIAVPGTTKVL
jgi:myo-inositol 2-dehydrogenase / D-chiro-inositol 1-dehydrogenase